MTEADVDEAEDRALERRKLKCPRCGRVAFVDPDAGGVGTRCPACGGVHLSASDVEHVIGFELGVDASALRAKARPPEKGEVVGRCSSCEAPLALVALESVDVELCLRCGAGWLDVGELERLTHGRHLERRAPDEIARAYLPRGLAKGRSRVTIARPFNRRSALVGLLASTSAISACGVGIGLPLPETLLTSLLLTAPPLGLWSLLASLLRERIVVDHGRKQLRAKNFYGLPMDAWSLSLDDVQAIAVEPVFATGTPSLIVAWKVVPRLKSGRELSWFCSVDRVLIHRLAFQLSQALEVPVETPPDDDSA